MIKTTIHFGLVLAAFFSMAARSWAQGSMFAFTSTPQSIIGQGETFTATPANGFNFTAERNSANGVSLIILSETRYWFLDFAASGGIPLAVGTYDNAMIWPYQSGSNPGMLFSGEGRTVSSLTGSFTVLAIEYGPNNTINRFDADFVQNDGGLTEQQNVGSIRFAIDPVPEPATVSLIAAGLLALLAMNWRRGRMR